MFSHPAARRALRTTARHREQGPAGVPPLLDVRLQQCSGAWAACGTAYADWVRCIKLTCLCMQPYGTEAPRMASIIHPDSQTPLHWTERAAGAVLAAPQGWAPPEARVRLLYLFAPCLHLCLKQCSHQAGCCDSVLQCPPRDLSTPTVAMMYSQPGLPISFRRAMHRVA